MTMKKTRKSLYGMRLSKSYDEPILGLLWEYQEIDELVLRFYYVNEYDRYVYEEIERLSLNSVCTAKDENEVFAFLRRIAKNKKPSYNIYIEKECYEAISRACKAKKLIW